MLMVDFDGPPSWYPDASKLPEGRGGGGHGGHYQNHSLYSPQAFCALPSFACIKRPRQQPVELNDRHLQSHRKIGDS